MERWEFQLALIRIAQHIFIENPKRKQMTTMVKDKSTPITTLPDCIPRLLEELILPVIKAQQPHVMIRNVLSSDEVLALFWDNHEKLSVSFVVNRLIFKR